jgi:hypothetical protein
MQQGILTIAYLGSPSPKKTPTPACAPCLPLPRLLPSVYTVTVLAFNVLEGAESALFLTFLDLGSTAFKAVAVELFPPVLTNSSASALVANFLYFGPFTPLISSEASAHSS